MRTVKIYLAHALSIAPVAFLDRMDALKKRIKALPGVETLDFAWAKGTAFNQSVNVYEYDMKHVESADIVVFVLDELSFGLAMELHKRCMIRRPFLAFIKAGQRVSKIVPDCMKYYEVPDAFLIEYGSESEIVGRVNSAVAGMLSNKSIREFTALVDSL
jgi:nucleoside 2-deoxyribosyltransferase